MVKTGAVEAALVYQAERCSGEGRSRSFKTMNGQAIQ